MGAGGGWGEQVWRLGGVNAWASTNGMVVMYPQNADCWTSKWNCGAAGSDPNCLVQLQMVQGMMADVRANKAKLTKM